MSGIDSSGIFQAEIGGESLFHGLARRVAAAVRALAAADEVPERVLPRDLVSREEVRFILDEWRKSAA